MSPSVSTKTLRGTTSQTRSYTLLYFEAAYICLAISKLRFMYCAKPFEFIGDCCVRLFSASCAPSLLCETDSNMSSFILFFVCTKIGSISETSKLLQWIFHSFCDRILWAVCVLSQKLGSVATSRGRK